MSTSQEVLPPQEHLLKLRETLYLQAIEAAKLDFFSFTKFIAPSLVPDFKIGKHIEVICQKLQRVVTSPDPQRLMVFLPPRSSKSLICSQLFPSWYIGNFPSHEIMSISHSDQLASDFGRTVRDILKMPLYQEIFPAATLREDVRAAGKWKTKQNGIYYAAGVRSQIAGRGAHIALIDDAMSEEDAFSEAGRRYIKEWYPSGLRTRLMPNGSVIIINTRYHEDDLCGWLLSNETEDTIPWDVISIPAWLDEDSADLLNLPEGSSYFPEWKPDELLRLDEAEIRANNGGKYWQALYMQNPTPDEGSAIKSHWFQNWDEEDPPECDLIIQTYDTAFSTRSTADYSVIQTWGIFEYLTTDLAGREYMAPNMILLGNVRERLEYPELRRTAQDLYDSYQPDICIIEKKASGQSLIQDMRRAGLPVLDYLPDRDKVARVHAITPILESERVWLPRGKDWAEDLFAEAIQFPYARHDDQVDAMAMAILYLKESWHLSHPDDPSYEEDEYKPKKRTYWNWN